MGERLWLVDGIDGGDGVVDPSEHSQGIFLYTAYLTC